MKPGYIWNLAATVLPGPSEFIWNSWYDNEHIPGNIKFKEAVSITRYKVSRYSDTATCKLYPTYLGNYEFKTEAAWSRWNASPEFQETMITLDKLYPRLGVYMLWRVQYEALKVWKNTNNIATINVVGVNTPKKELKAFNDWVDNEYMPKLLKSKKLMGAARFKIMGAKLFAVKASAQIAVNEYPETAIMYYFPDVPSVESFKDSAEYCAAQLEWLKMLKQTRTELMWEFQMEHQRTWGKVEPDLEALGYLWTPEEHHKK